MAGEGPVQENAGGVGQPRRGRAHHGHAVGTVEIQAIRRVDGHREGRWVVLDRGDADGAAVELGDLVVTHVLGGGWIQRLVEGEDQGRGLGVDPQPDEAEDGRPVARGRQTVTETVFDVLRGLVELPL